MPNWRFTKLVLALVFHVLALNLAYGQGVQLETAPEPETIRGTVVNSVTHEPVERALVHSPGNEFAALTDSEGHFEFTCNQGNAGTSPCPTSLIARRPGFVERYTAQPVTSGKDLVLNLTPEALIVGHVVLPSSEPPDRIQVELYQRRVQGGRGHWIMAGSTQTRSNGEFRFADLAAGSYKLLTRELLDRDPLTFNPRGPLFGYPPAYFSSATDFVSAETIQLTAGKTFQADIPLTKHPYYQVKIPVINVSPGAGIGVRVSVQGHSGPGFALGYNMADQIIDGMLPDGTYTVEGSMYGQVRATGLITITVKGGPVTGPRMVLVENGSITVNVKEEFTSTEDVNTGNAVAVDNGALRRAERYPMDYLNLHLESADEFAENPGVSRMGPSGPDGKSITLGDIRPGRYWVNVSSSRGYAASITSGGIDLQHQPLVVPAAGSTDPIEITMRDDWAEVDCSLEGAGTSTPERQNFASGRQSNPHAYFVPQPDSAGEFRDLWMPSPAGAIASTQLPPGLYRVLTFDDQQPELEYHDAEAMRAYESKGQLIRLGAGQKEHLRLQIIPTSE